MRKPIERKTFDIEPTWKRLVEMWKEMDRKVGDKYVYPDLMKMADVADVVRQAQKHNRTVTFFPDGSVKDNEVK